jgi:hypothetical protein
MDNPLSVFNWMGHLVSIVRDETTPGGSLICANEDDAIAIMTMLKSKGVGCYYAGSDAVTGEAAVRVVEKDIHKAQRLCNLPVQDKKAQPGCFNCMSIIFGVIVLVVGCYALLAAQAMSGVT